MNSSTIQVRFPRREYRFTVSLHTMRRQLMLVDDDPAVREMLGRVLTAEGYLVLPAANGQEALDLAAATAVDLLDLNLPVKNGWDTFACLTTENPLLPILIITARPNQLFPRWPLASVH